MEHRLFSDNLVFGTDCLFGRGFASIENQLTSVEEMAVDEDARNSILAGPLETQIGS